MTINLQTRTGHTNMVAAVGLLVFQQFWYWYPLAHTLCLAFTPTAIIGLNDKLQVQNQLNYCLLRKGLFGNMSASLENIRKRKENYSAFIKKKVLDVEIIAMKTCQETSASLIKRSSLQSQD